MMTCFFDDKVDFGRGGPVRKRQLADLDFEEQLAETENCEDSSIFRVSIWTDEEVERWVDFREGLNRESETNEERQ